MPKQPSSSNQNVNTQKKFWENPVLFAVAIALSLAFLPVAVWLD